VRSPGRAGERLACRAAAQSPPSVSSAFSFAALALRSKFRRAPLNRRWSYLLVPVFLFFLFSLPFFPRENGSREVRFSSISNGVQVCTVQLVIRRFVRYEGRDGRDPFARDGAQLDIASFTTYTCHLCWNMIFVSVSLASSARALDFLSAIWNRYWLSRDF